jgi:hypothetical protein
MGQTRPSRIRLCTQELYTQKAPIIQLQSLRGLQHHAKNAPSGFTVLEVLAALFILGCTLTAVMQLMVTGDRINARRLGISNATIAASNQVETIRQQEESMALLEDTTYETSLNGIDFEVKRTRISPLNPIRPDTVINYLEFAVMVKRKNQDIPLVNFRLLQGLHEK